MSRLALCIVLTGIAATPAQASLISTPPLRRPEIETDIESRVRIPPRPDPCAPRIRIEIRTITERRFSVLVPQGTRIALPGILKVTALQYRFVLEPSTFPALCTRLALPGHRGAVGDPRRSRQWSWHLVPPLTSPDAELWYAVSPSAFDHPFLPRLTPPFLLSIHIHW